MPCLTSLGHPRVRRDAGFLYITGGVTLALLGAFYYFATNR